MGKMSVDLDQISHPTSRSWTEWATVPMVKIEITAKGLIQIDSISKNIEWLIFTPTL